MAFDAMNARIAKAQADATTPMFYLQRVSRDFETTAGFVAAQVANNILILALFTGRILNYNLDDPQNIINIYIPERYAEIGMIRRPAGCSSIHLPRTSSYPPL